MSRAHVAQTDGTKSISAALVDGEQAIVYIGQFKVILVDTPNGINVTAITAADDYIRFERMILNPPKQDPNVPRSYECKLDQQLGRSDLPEDIREHIKQKQELRLILWERTDTGNRAVRDIMQGSWAWIRGTFNRDREDWNEMGVVAARIEMVRKE